MSLNDSGKLLAQRSAYKHWVDEHVRWSDTDLVGHANNLTFGAFAETGRCLFLRSYSERNSANRASFLPAQLLINFLGELFWPAQVEIGTGVLSIGNTSFRVGQGLFEGERCFGTVETALVMIDESTRRPQRIPDTIRDWLTDYMLR